MRFLHRMSGRSWLLSLLLLQTERSQLRRFCHLIRRPLGRVPDTFHLRGDHGTDPEYDGGIKHPIWPGRRASGTCHSQEWENISILLQIGIVEIEDVVNPPVVSQRGGDAPVTRQRFFDSISWEGFQYWTSQENMQNVSVIIVWSFTELLKFYNLKSVFI